MTRHRICHFFAFFANGKKTTLRTLLVLTTLSGVLAVAGAVSGKDKPTQEAVDAAIAKVYPALVRIHVVAERPKDGRMEKYGGTGSGTIVHPDGYVVTNHHVAGNGTRVWCRLSDKTKVDATVVGTDPQTDLCVIKLDLDQVPDSQKPLPHGKVWRLHHAGSR